MKHRIQNKKILTFMKFQKIKTNSIDLKQERPLIIQKIKQNLKNKYLLNNIQSNKNLLKYFDNNLIKNEPNI